jgi:hypothetical protein
MENQSDPQAVMSVYGFAEEATKFDLRHPLWHQRMPRLAHAIDLAFTRTHTMDTPEEKFVYFYGTLIAEDFMEILLMAVNGYGVAAMKLLGSMYEHTVTLRYLHDHPDEVGTFMAYDHVQQYKLMRPIVETFGTGVLPPETVADVERRYEEVKNQFMVTDCRKCGTKGINHTWNKLDFRSDGEKDRGNRYAHRSRLLRPAATCTQHFPSNHRQTGEEGRASRLPAGIAAEVGR